MEIGQKLYSVATSHSAAPSEVKAGRAGTALGNSREVTLNSCRKGYKYESQDRKKLRGLCFVSKKVVEKILKKWETGLLSSCFK